MKRAFAVDARLRQRRFLLVLYLWIIYAMVYLGRTNLSVVITALETELSSGKAAIALLGTLYFWFYAAGKLVNGYIGDYANNKWMIFIGMSVAGIANLCMGMTRSVGLMLIFWSINGFAQSSIWCNLVKILTRWYPAEQRARPLVWLSTSAMGGSALGLLVCGQLIAVLPWQWVFLIPGMMLLLCGGIWLLVGKNSAAEAGYDVDSLVVRASDKALEPKPNQKLLPFIFSSGLLAVMMVCLAQGVIKESIGLWGTVMLQEGFNVDAGSAASLLVGIPIANFLGVLLVGALSARGISQEKLSAILLILCAGCLLGLRFCTNLAMYVLLLAVISTLMYGVNTLLLGLYPLRYARQGRVSFASGFLDSAAYIAAGGFSFVTGMALDHGLGWNAVFGIWIGLVMVGLVFLVFLMRRSANDG